MLCAKEMTPDTASNSSTRSVSYASGQPISGSTSNVRRAVRAVRALAAYQRELPHVDVDTRILLISLLTDIRHLCDELDIDWEDAIDGSFAIASDERAVSRL